MIVGIDLGTTNSLAAIWRDGAPKLVPNALGEFLTPSIVAVDDNGEILIGRPAAERMLVEPETTAALFKRDMGTNKTVRLGSRTDTGDAEGRVVEEAAIPPLDAGGVEAVLGKFRGLQSQVPPMYSALKRDGRPLYELARKGVEVERAPREVEIRRLELTGLRPDALDLVCECAKGTYIRVLGEDIARQLGTLGHLTRLRRLWVEPFKGMPMTTLEDALAQAANPAGLMPPDAALQALPRAGLDEGQVVALRHGQAVRAGTEPVTHGGRRVRVYGPDGAFLGLAEPTPDGRLQPRRLISSGVP